MWAPLPVTLERRATDPHLTLSDTASVRPHPEIYPGAKGHTGKNPYATTPIQVAYLWWLTMTRPEMWGPVLKRGDLLLGGSGGCHLPPRGRRWDVTWQRRRCLSLWQRNFVRAEKSMVLPLNVLGNSENALGEFLNFLERERGREGELGARDWGPVVSKDGVKMICGSL
ncbi:hypothetical protein AMTR_s00040p00189760 [Amborella trichopoda]|uniref:Uncharacterized protein n=1 Tax=Amborella trichopoda TaxID=13333 RepID=W1PXZ3_AMBTC|nr:hypothetical protein AMTR_s00040p00189760 [Amborella trichopoda]